LEKNVVYQLGIACQEEKENLKWTPSISTVSTVDSRSELMHISSFVLNAGRYVQGFGAFKSRMQGDGMIDIRPFLGLFAVLLATRK
jgi:hypothetical protein